MLGCLLLCCLPLCATAGQADSSALALHRALKAMNQAQPDEAAFYAIDSLTITHQDMQLELAAGEIMFFAPVMFDSTARYFAAYYRGPGVLQFMPPVQIERDQLHRFFGSDSLNRPIEDALLVFEDSLAQVLRARCRATDRRPPKQMLREAVDRRKDLTENENYYYVFTALRALLETTDKPLLLINCRPKESDRLIYLYNPFSGEEVSLYREHRAPGEDYFELVNSYHENLDETYAQINGPARGRLEALHYVLAGAIDRKGKYTGQATVTLRAHGAPTRLAFLYLHPELEVDSVFDSGERAVPLIRYEDDVHMSPALYLCLNDEIRQDDSLTLSVYSHGDIAKAEIGIFDVTAGGEWYPHVSYRQYATFDMTFRTPLEYEFVAVGNEVARDTIGDTLITHWRVEEPVSNVSFTIGPVQRYEFGDSAIGPVEVYYSEDVHERITWGRLGYETPAKDIEEQVAADVIGAVKLFTDWFGPFPHERLVVTEVFSYHGEAFPGFLHLGLQTWMTGDRWGNEKLFRAHETAHQWWGVALGYETYHDQWLSEAFAEYSALLYIEETMGRERYDELLREYRDEILSVRNYGFGIKGAEAGPIILGSRTAGTKTEGDYELIVYKKGAWVLHMLRELLDRQEVSAGQPGTRFRAMMADFFTTYAGGEAATADFQSVVEKHSGEDMDWFFRQWVYGTEIPGIDARWRKDQDSAGWYLYLTVNVAGVDSSFHWPASVSFVMEGARWEEALEVRPPVTIRRFGPYPDKARAPQFRLSLEMLGRVR